jgi:TolB-like protein
MKRTATALIIGLLMLGGSRPVAAEEYQGSDINDFVVKVARAVAGHLKQGGAAEVVVVPYKNADDDADYALSEVITGALLQELKYNYADIRILAPGESGAVFRVTGVWKVKDAEVQVTTRIVKMPAGDVEINFAGTIPVAKVPKVYIGRARPATQKPDRGIRVAIMPFVGVQKYGDLEHLNLGLPEAITTVFAKNSDLVLIERLQRDKVLSELAIAESRYADPDAALRIGKELNANYVIIGSYQRSGRRLRLMARRVKSETGEIFEAASVIGNESDIFDLEDALAKSLLDDIQKYR